MVVCNQATNRFVRCSNEADIYRDGPNADRVGIDYVREKRTIVSSDNLRIHLAPGGGWAARIRLSE